MIYSIRIDGVQRPPVTVEQLGALIDRREFKPGDSLFGPGLPHWVTGVEAGGYLRAIFRQRLPLEFGSAELPRAAPSRAAAASSSSAASPFRSSQASAQPEPSGCALLAKIALAAVVLGGVMMLALFLLLYGLCGGFR